MVVRLKLKGAKRLKREIKKIAKRARKAGLSSAIVATVVEAVLPQEDCLR